jgi:hypothetical protein
MHLIFFLSTVALLGLSAWGVSVAREQLHAWPLVVRSGWLLTPFGDFVLCVLFALSFGSGVLAFGGGR